VAVDNGVLAAALDRGRALSLDLAKARARTLLDA
jgi:hypothetical protein